MHVCNTACMVSMYVINVYQARIQLLAKGEVVKIMENNFFLPQAANVTDRMPRKRVPQPARMSFSGYTIDSECTSWEPIGCIDTMHANLPVGAEPRCPTTF